MTPTFFTKKIDTFARQTIINFARRIECIDDRNDKQKTFTDKVIATLTIFSRKNGTGRYFAGKRTGSKRRKEIGNFRCHLLSIIR